MNKTIAVFTTDGQLGAKLLAWLAAQENVEKDSTLIVVGYDERQRAIDCLAKEVNINTDNPHDVFIDDLEFGDDLIEEIGERALELAQE
jgi:hypothetical protein